MRGLQLGTSEHVWVWSEPCHMGKATRGLSKLIIEKMKRQPHSGDFFLFANKRRTQVKIFFFNKGGFCILSKWLPHGHFDFEQIEDAKSISLREMQALIEVVNLKPKVKAFPVRKTLKAA